MKRVLAILLCAVMTLSLVACGADKQDKQALDNKMDSTDTNALSGDNDMIVGSWFCDEVQEELDFTDSAMVTVTTPMVNDSGSYKLEDGKLIMKFNIGDDIYDYELSDSALILKNSDGTYTFTRGTADFSIENVDNNNTSTSADASLLSVVVYGKNEADVYCQLDKMPQAGVQVYFEGTPYMLIYGDVGAGLSANVCNSTNGSVLGNILYEISDTEVVFHADMSSYADFSFESVSSYTVSIDYDGNGGGMLSYAANDVVKYGERTNTIAENKETDETSAAKTFDISKIVGHYMNTLGNQNKPDELLVEEAFGGPAYHFAIFAAYEYMTISSGGAYDYTAGFDPSEVSSSADGSWKISLPTNGGYEADFTINSDGSIDVLVTGFSTTYNGHFVKD